MARRTIRLPARALGRAAGRLALAAPAICAGLGGALASQGPGVADGTAEPVTRAVAAAMALFPPVAVAVFALAKLLLPNGR